MYKLKIRVGGDSNFSLATYTCDFDTNNTIKTFLIRKNNQEHYFHLQPVL